MSTKYFSTILAMMLCVFASCSSAQQPPSAVPTAAKPDTTIAPQKNPGKVIHVLVALCDNENQGIVPVPAHLGNGEDTAKNLYWGAAYGVKTFFGKSKNWERLATVANPKDHVLERIVFKHKTQNVYLVADAYRGSKMRETIDDFFSAVSGEKREDVKAGNASLQILGGANVVAFVGHNGLMDFKFEKAVAKPDEESREAIILACASRNYFSEHLQKTNAKPLLWTSNLMAPEAYILHDALESWINGQSAQAVRESAAAAYAKYQKIKVSAAKKLLVTGW
jgi:hypothetical protein